MQTQLLLNNLRAIAKGLNDCADDIEKDGGFEKFSAVPPKRNKLQEDLHLYENLISAIRRSA